MSIAWEASRPQPKLSFDRASRQMAQRDVLNKVQAQLSTMENDLRPESVLMKAQRIAKVEDMAPPLRSRYARQPVTPTLACAWPRGATTEVGGDTRWDEDDREVPTLL